jgi:hypothetical protein
MLRLTRVSRTLDTSRLANALRVPGIDPRIWNSLAIVTGTGIDEEGLFANVTLMPSRQELTARVGCAYAGPSFGLYVPIEVDDEVIVECPSGDPSNGLVITGRLHSMSDKLPQEAQNHPTDLVLVVKKGSSLRVMVSGGGNVLLGDIDASDPVMRKSDGDAIIAKYLAHTHVAPGGTTAVPGPAGIWTNIPPDVPPSGSLIVKVP